MSAYSEDFITIVFMQGEEADEAFDIWDRDGFDAVVNYLQEWDFGDENDNAAIVMNETYSDIKDITGRYDFIDIWESEHGNYWVTSNRSLSYISLIRKIGE
jgi:hypothetical protein